MAGWPSRDKLEVSPWVGDIIVGVVGGLDGGFLGLSSLTYRMPSMASISPVSWSHLPDQSS